MIYFNSLNPGIYIYKAQDTRLIIGNEACYSSETFGNFKSMHLIQINIDCNIKYLFVILF